MELQDYLREVLQADPTCEGLLLMGMDGLAVAKAVREPMLEDTLESFAAEYTHCLQFLHRTLEQAGIESTPLEHVHITPQYTIVARFVSPSYYVMMRIRPGGLLGRARYRLRRLCRRLAVEIPTV